MHNDEEDDRFKFGLACRNGKTCFHVADTRLASVQATHFGIGGLRIENSELNASIMAT